MIILAYICIFVFIGILLKFFYKKEGFIKEAGISNKYKEKIGLHFKSGFNDLFYKTRFSPECCPSVYTTSKGCACFCDDNGEYETITTRGGNRTKYSFSNNYKP
jgi:hypothetical protein